MTNNNISEKKIIEILTNLICSKKRGELTVTRKTEWGCYVEDKCKSSVEFKFIDNDFMKINLIMQGKNYQEKIKIKSIQTVFDFHDLVDVLCA